MKIVLAIDSFKGCLTSIEVEQIVAKSFRKYIPDVIINMIPIADGGDGTLSILSDVLGAQLHECSVYNPCMELIPCQYAMSPSHDCALIEMAAASGLSLIPPEKHNPMKTTTYGTGQLIADALDKGCTNFIIGLGGSATNDAGVGMLQALGFQFFDKDGNELGQGGEILDKIASWSDVNKHPLLQEAHFTVACDVNNPLYGENGAACVYAAQKGADAAMIQQLDKGLFSFARQIYETIGIDISRIPGSGAAGGLGGGMMAFLNSELKSGASLVLELSGFERRIDDADFIITGEGRMDNQTLMGKIPGCILQIGKQYHIDVLGLAGSVSDMDKLLAAGFFAIYPVTPPDMPLDEAMKPCVTEENIMKAVENICTSLLTK